MCKPPKNLSRNILLLLILLFSGRLSLAQSSTGTFNSNSFQFNLNKKWSSFVETELRSVSFFRKFYYYELKAGVTYQHSPALSFSLGNGIYNTFNGGADYDNVKTNFDYRIWEQAQLKHAINVVSVEHRLRIEQVVNKNFRPNFRYRLQARAGLNKKEISKGTVFAAVYDEVFFKTIDPVFSRNRFQAGVGYVFSPAFSAQLGYIRQVDYSKDLSFGKNYFYYSASFKF